MKTRIAALLKTMSEAWRLGSGLMFAEPFAHNAHFVAFDGSVHSGSADIAAFHQAAFDTVLQGTSLELVVDEMRQVDQSIWLVFGKGWHWSGNTPKRNQVTESVIILVCKLDEGSAEVLAFQNTRKRPITNAVSAGTWKAFDGMWEHSRHNGT